MYIYKVYLVLIIIWLSFKYTIAQCQFKQLYCCKILFFNPIHPKFAKDLLQCHSQKEGFEMNVSKTVLLSAADELTVW